MRKTRSTVTVLLAALALSACTKDRTADAPDATDDQPKVVAAFYPLFEAASRVAGDRAAVTNLVSAGAEPHDLELSPDQVEDLEDADLAIVMGDGFQPAVEEVAGRRDGVTIEALDGEKDPHVWLDPRRMKAITEQIADALAEVDPDGAEQYEANAAELTAELDALHERMSTGLKGCARTTIVTAHDAFGHLADAYGLTQEPIAGIEPDSEPAPARISELADLIERTGTTTVFTETLVSPEVAETLAREAGVTTAVLNPVEGLTSDEAEDGVGYVQLMDANLAALRTALGCP